MLEACVVRGVRERLPEDGVTYQAAADPSGGRRDAFTVALGHQVGDRIVVDVVRDWAAPFNPSGVVAEAADLCRRYRVHALVGDNFGAEWIVEPFRQHGITYRGAALDRSRLYLELLPIVNTQGIALPDLAPLLRELRGLERRRGVSGRDRIVPSPHEHDDRAVSVAGLAAGFLVRGQRGFEGWRPYAPEPGPVRPVTQVEVIERAWHLCPTPGCGWQTLAGPVDPATCPACLSFAKTASDSFDDDPCSCHERTHARTSEVAGPTQGQSAASDYRPRHPETVDVGVGPNGAGRIAWGVAGQWRQSGRAMRDQAACRT